MQNEADRIRINREVAEYLAKGGKIQKVDHTANHTYRQPIKRKRKDQVEWARRYAR